MICSACDYNDELEITGTCTIVLHEPAHSLNTVGVNSRRDNRMYKKERRRWERALQPYLHLKPATGHRRVFFTRFWGARKRAFDYGNLVGGFKPLLDMLVKMNLLLDDKPALCSEYYRQMKSPDGIGHIILVLEDVPIR